MKRRVRPAAITPPVCRATLLETCVETCIAAGLAACLAGCASPPGVVNHYQTILPDMPAMLAADCPVAPPPDRTTYLAGNAQQKEDLLAQAYIAQTTNLANCNIDKKNLRDWWAQTKAAIDGTNAAGGPDGANGANDVSHLKPPQ